MSVLMRWYCGGVMLSCPHQLCPGHGVTPLIRQQAEAAAWRDGARWADADQQRYLNDAGRFVIASAEVDTDAAWAHWFGGEA